VSPARASGGSIGGGGGASRKATAFTRGQCDVIVLMLPPLGQLSTCKVWLDQEGDPWHLEIITVTNAAGKTWYGEIKREREIATWRSRVVTSSVGSWEGPLGVRNTQ
jgi:hypothetical protein